MRARMAGCLAVVSLVLASCAAASDGAGDGDWQNFSAPTGAAASTFTRTRYPIVLAHGLSGFRQLFGVVDYFFGIPGDLQSSGARAFVTRVSAVGSPEGRGEQRPRYVLAVRPDLSASLTTVAAPHLGAGLADFFADNIADGGFNGTVRAAFGNSLGTVIDLLTGTTSPQDALGAVRSLSSAGAAEFNQRFPAGLAATRCGATPSSAGGVPLFS